MARFLDKFRMSSDHNEGSQIPQVLPNQEADKKAEGSIPPAPLTRTKGMLI